MYAAGSTDEDRQTDRQIDPRTSGQVAIVRGVDSKAGVEGARSWIVEERDTRPVECAGRAFTEQMVAFR